MAKTKAEQTPTQKKVLDLRQKLEVAYKNDEKSSSPATKKIVADLEAELKTAVTADNRDRFKRVGGSRARKVFSAIKNFGKVASPRSYEYSLADVDAFEKKAHDELSKAVAALKNAKEKTPAVAKTVDDFDFV